ncbi:cytochrome c biogenesis protein CcdA [soil metagenome]
MRQSFPLQCRIRLFPFWVLCAILVLLVPGRPVPAQSSKSKAVQVAARFEPATAKLGEDVSLILTVTIDPKYHIYSQHAGTGPISTKIALAPDAPVALKGDWIEPTPTKRDDPSFGPIEVILGSPLEFKNTVTIPATAAGDVEVKGTFLVQACTEVSCLPPAKLPFMATLKLEGGAGAATLKVARVGAPATPAPTPALAISTPLEQQPVPTANVLVTRSGSFLGFILFAFGAGLAALATPCVFPMIPITVTFFTGKGTKTTREAAMNAGVYVLSIIASFAILGFGVAVLLRIFHGDAAFVNRLAANPWVNVFFAGLYFFFALSLFEIIHLELPPSLAAKFNKGAIGKSGYGAIAAKAMVFVLISFTCTAPLMGALMVQALGGEWTRPFFGMSAFGAGLGLPFFILAIAPQMLGALPKAGDWLYATKIVMGLLVIAAAFKFVSNADLVWLKERMIFSRGILLTIWTVLFATIAIYLYGFVKLGEGSGGKIGGGRYFIGTAFGAVALYLALGLFGRPLNVWIEAYLPTDFSQTTEFMEVEPALAEAARLNKPLFIDFTGYSCTNCRLMEKDIFPRPEIAKRLDQFVRVKLFTDDLQEGERRQEYQEKTFGTVSLPFYAVMTPEGKVLGTIELERDPEKYAAFLDLGLK